jgi:hypothetical protein
MPSIKLYNPLTRVLWKKPECPVCTSIKFRRSEPRSMDKMLRLVNLVPLQCTNCFRYFYWLRDDREFVSHADGNLWMN